MNEDSIIGVWQKNIKTASNGNLMIIDYEKYIFKEVCLGAFHGDANGKLTFRADFRWELNVDGYIIYYPRTDFPP